MPAHKTITSVFLIFCFLLCCFFAPRCYSQTTLILDEDKDDLSILIHTKYLDKTPVLLFSYQNDTSAIVSHGLKDIDNFIFVDKDPNERTIGLPMLSLIKQRSKDPSVEIGYIFKKNSGLFFNNSAAYTMKVLIIQEEGLSTMEGKENSWIVKIDDVVFGLDDFPGRDENDKKNGIILEKTIHLDPGIHRYENLKNPSFSIRWLILEPQASPRSAAPTPKKPVITFLRINPTKYVLKVREAKAPFWLVFSETYHSCWRLYRADFQDSRDAGLSKFAAEYTGLGVREMWAKTAFTPKDMKFLLVKPLDLRHYQVNSYANGWYIDPKALGLGSDFDLVLYFSPQSFFYLGLCITLVTLFVCCLWQALVFLKSLFKAPKNAKV